MNGMPTERYQDRLRRPGFGEACRDTVYSGVHHSATVESIEDGNAPTALHPP